MDLAITGKVMLITGGASGIGEAITRTIAAEGGFPVIIEKDEAAGNKLAEKLQKQGYSCDLIIRDLSGAEHCRTAVSEALGRARRIDALINNAGINDGVGLEEGSPQAFADSLTNNLHHYYYMAQACLPELKKNRGAIVNISSKTAVTGQGGTSGYVASKAAQLGLTREWAAELSGYGIRVNAVVPAEVMTPQYRNQLNRAFADPEEARQSVEQRIPLGNRFTNPQEIADMAVFLTSERASHITGQHIYVDGGYVHLDRAITGNKE